MSYNGPWQSSDPDGSHNTLINKTFNASTGNGGKYLHVILIGGGGIGSMTARSDWPVNTLSDYLKDPNNVGGGWTAAYGGSSGGYLEFFINLEPTTVTTTVTITGTGAPGSRSDIGGPNPSTGTITNAGFLELEITNTSLVPNSPNKAYFRSRGGYPSSYSGTDATILSNLISIATTDESKIIIIKNVPPVPAIMNYCGQAGYVGPNGLTYGSGASQDDSTPATGGYWFVQQTDTLPAGYAFKVPPGNPIYTTPVPDGPTHILLTIVAPGSANKSGDAILEFPVLITNRRGQNIIFTKGVNRQFCSVTIGNGSGNGPEAKTIKMYNPQFGIASYNEFLPNDTKDYSVKQSIGTYVNNVKEYHGGITDTDPVPLDTGVGSPAFSWSYATITKFDSFSFSAADTQYPTDISVAPFDKYDYIKAKLIGGGGTGRGGPGGGQGGLTEFYININSIGSETLSLNIEPNIYGTPDAIFTYGDYSVTAQGGIGWSTGGSIIQTPETTSDIIKTISVKGQDGAGSLPGGFSPQWQQLYTAYKADLAPYFVSSTPYTDHPDKANIYQCYGSGGQSNASFYTSSGPGAAYWSFEFVKSLPRTDSSKNPNTYQNTGTLPDNVTTVVQSSQAGTINDLSGCRFLHYVLIGPGDAGNGAYCGGAGGYIEAYVDILGPRKGPYSGENGGNFGMGTEVLINFTQGLASQVVATTDSILTITDTTGTENYSTAIAFGSKGADGAVTNPFDTYTMIVKSVAGQRGTQTTPGPGYLGKDNVMYGAGGSRGSGGSEYKVAQSGYFWYEFTNTPPKKNGWNSNDDFLTYYTGTGFFSNYRYLHYILIGGGNFSSVGGLGGAGGAYVESYIDLESKTAGDSAWPEYPDTIRNGYINIATGDYDIGDGRGPTKNSFIFYRDFNLDGAPVIVQAIAEGGTTSAYNFGGLTSLIEFDLSGNQFEDKYKYSIPARLLYGNEPPFNSSKPAEGYLGIDGFSYGFGGQAYPPFAQPASDPYWFYEFTNKAPPPTSPDNAVSQIGPKALLPPFSNFRYIHYIIIGGGSTQGGGGSLIEAYFDTQLANTENPVYQYSFGFKKEATKTIFQYGGPAFDSSNQASAIAYTVAGSATAETGGSPDGYKNNYTYCVRVLKGVDGILNEDQEVVIPAAGYSGKNGTYYGAGGMPPSLPSGGYFWYEFTDYTPQVPYVQPEPPQQNQNIEEDDGFGLVAAPALDFIPPLSQVPLSPIFTKWDSNDNAYSYPNTNAQFPPSNNKFLHGVLIGPGEPGTSTKYGNSGSYLEFYTDLESISGEVNIDVGIIKTDMSGAVVFNINSGNILVENTETIAEFILASDGKKQLNPGQKTYIAADIPPNLGTEIQKGLGFTGMDGKIYGAGGGPNNSLEPGAPYWAFEFSNTIPLPKSWDSLNDETNYPTDISFFQGRFSYIHYVLIGPASAKNGSGQLIEGYLDISGINSGDIDFQLEAQGAKFTYTIPTGPGTGTTVAKKWASSAATFTTDMHSVFKRKLKFKNKYKPGSNNPNPATNPEQTTGYIGPDGLVHGDWSTETDPGYWWFELTNKIPKMPVESTNVNSLTANFDNDPTSDIYEPYTYLHYIIVAAGSNGSSTGGGGAIVEAYVNLNLQSDDTGSVSFKKGTTSDPNSTFTYRKNGEVVSTASVSTGNLTQGGAPSPPTDPLSYIVTSQYGGWPGSNWSPSNQNGWGGSGYSAPDGNIYGAGGNWDGNGAASQNGYCWYEFTSVPPVSSWSSTNKTSYPTNTRFFSNFSHLHYVLIGSGHFGSGGQGNIQGGGGGAYIEAYLNLDQAGQNGIIDFEIKQATKPDGTNKASQDVIFKYTEPGSGKVLSRVVAGGGGSAVSDMSGGILTKPYDLYTFSPMSSNGNRGRSGSNPGPDDASGATGFYGYDNTGQIYGSGGTNYNQNFSIGGYYPGPAYWWFEFTSTNPPPSLTFDSKLGIFPNDFSQYSSYRYARYVMIGAGSDSGGSGSLLDVYVDLNRAGRDGVLKLTQGNPYGAGKDTTFICGSLTSSTAGGATGEKGGIPSPPLDSYSYVSRSLIGQNLSDMSGNSTPGYRGLDGNFYGQGHPKSPGFGYWSIEFTNRAPTTNPIINVIKSKMGPTTTTTSTTTSTTEPGTTEPGTTEPGTTEPGTTEPGTTEPGTTEPGTTSTTMFPSEFVPAYTFGLDLPKTDEDGTMGPITSLPISIPMMDLSGSGVDISGGFTALVHINITSNPIKAGQVDISNNTIAEPVSTDTVISIPLTLNTSGSEPVFEGFPTTDPAFTPLLTTDTLTFTTVIKSDTSGTEVAGAEPASLSITPGIVPPIPLPLVIPPSGSSQIAIQGTPKLELTGNGLTGEVNISLNAILGNSPLNRDDMTTAYTQGETPGNVSVFATINNDPTLYTYTFPLETKGNKLTISGSGNLNNVVSTGSTTTQQTNTITLTLSGEILTDGQEENYWYSLRDQIMLDWTPNFIPIAPIEGYLPPKWTSGHTYGLYAIYNTEITDATDFVYNPEYLLNTFNSNTFNLSMTSAAPTSNLTLVIATTYDGMNFIFSNTATYTEFAKMELTGNQQGYLRSNTGIGTYSATAPPNPVNGITFTSFPAQYALCGTTNMTADIFQMAEAENRLSNTLPSGSTLWKNTIIPKKNAYPLLVAVLSYYTGPNAPTDLASSDFLKTETGIYLSPPDEYNILTIDVSGNDYLYASNASQPRSWSEYPPQPYAWNFGQRKNNFGIYISTDSSLSSESITEDQKNLVGQQDQAAYQLSNSVGNKYASKILVGAYNGFKPQYSNYIIVDTGVNAGYDSLNSLVYFSTTFEPVPIANTATGVTATETFKYIVYTSVSVSTQPLVKDIIAQSKFYLNTGAGKTVWAEGTNEQSIAYDVPSVANASYKVIVAASPDGKNICYSQPIVFKPTISGANISYNHLTKTINLLFEPGQVPFNSTNANMLVQDEIYISYNNSKTTWAAITGDNSLYFDYVPIGQANYTFSDTFPPASFPCRIAIKSSGTSQSSQSKLVLLLTSLEDTNPIVSFMKPRVSLTHKLPKPMPRNQRLSKNYYGTRAVGGGAPPIKLGDKLKISGFSIGLSDGAQYALNFKKPLSYFAACLLRGTEVLTPIGYRNIEDLKAGDIVISHRNLLVKITSVGVWRIEWTDTIAPSDIVYKVKKGKLGATKPLYISAHHKILQGGSMKNANCADLPMAKKEEIVEDDGFYTFFNIMVENHELNHLIVNGGVVVESWDGKYPYETKDLPALNNPYAIIV